MGQTEDRRGILFLVRFICETPHHDPLFDLLFLVPLPTSELLMILLFPIQQPDDFEILWCFLLHPEICCLPCLFLALLALRFVSAPSSSSHLCGKALCHLFLLPASLPAPQSAPALLHLVTNIATVWALSAVQGVEALLRP